MPQHQPPRLNPSSNDFHDYHAPSLPDPILDSAEDSTGSDSPQESGSSSSHLNHHLNPHGMVVVGVGAMGGPVIGSKHVCADSASGDEGGAGMLPASKKHRSMGHSATFELAGSSSLGATATAVAGGSASTGQASVLGLVSPSVGSTGHRSHGLPPNIARTGGIAHNIRVPASALAASASATSVGGHVNARLSSAPAIPLPPPSWARAPVASAASASASASASLPGALNTAAAAAAGQAAASAAVAVPATIVSGQPHQAQGRHQHQHRPTGNGVVALPPSLVAAASARSNGAPAAQVDTANGSGGSVSVLTSAAVIPSSRGKSNGNSNGNPKAIGFTSSSSAFIADNDGASSSNSSSGYAQILAYYHVNVDDMLLTEDVLMRPFVFRSQDAVQCGALAECVMPRMLRGQFSKTNKLLHVERVYDAMGFMQQLERASGSEGAAQIVPNSLEMALSPNTDEARLITLAKPPFLIVCVNEAWTRTTKYTQMEVEGKKMSIPNGKRTDPAASKRGNSSSSSKPVHDFAEVARGRCACSANVHYDTHGRDFVDFVCSYPLTKSNDEITHILHVCKELPVPTSPDVEFPDAPSALGGGAVGFHGQ